jgi:hypothetical protein
VGKVMTFGATKYAPNNWRRGMKWSRCINSLKRHVSAFEKGVDYDEETGLMHLEHAATNIAFLLEYYRIHPELDDRQHTYLQPKRIGVDLDEVCVNFTGMYAKHTTSTATPSHWNYSRDMMNNFALWQEDGTLAAKYLECEPLIKGEDLPFEPVVYLTNRPVDSAISREWLHKHNFPATPVVTVTNREEKVNAAKGMNLDIFIDDNYDTFVEMNKAGICCLLMSAPHNMKYNVGYRRIKDFNDFKNRFL